MACTPFEALRVATESLDQDVLKRGRARDLWDNIVETGAFPRNSGTTQTTFTIEQSEPVSDAESWTEITLSNNVLSPACDTTYTEVGLGYTERTYTPEEYGLKGPRICRDALDLSFKSDEFLNMYETVLAGRAMRTKSFWLRNKYIKFARKYIAAGGVPEIAENTAITAISTPATSELTPDIMDTVAANLLETDAADANQLGFVVWADSGPVFPAVIGVEAAQRLFKADSTVRQDLRNADEGLGIEKAHLFTRLGAKTALKNFRYAVTTVPPRFDIVGGFYVQRPTWVMSSASEGTKAVLNPAWLAAEYEGVVVALPTVFKAEAVIPDNWKFPARNYNGEFKLVVGAYRTGDTCAEAGDPFDEIGRHFVKFKMAAKPLFPDHGAVVIFKRCPNAPAMAYCS